MNVPTPVDPENRWQLPAPLAERLDDFTRWPSRNLHASRQEPSDRETLTRLSAFGPSAAVYWHRVKSEALSATHGLDDLPVPALPAALARVVLLDANELTALASLCGVTLQAPWVRSAIRREEVAQWREALGDSLYTFALRQAHRFHPLACMTPHMLAMEAGEAFADTLLAGPAMTSEPAPVQTRAALPQGAVLLPGAVDRDHLSVLGTPRMRQTVDAIGWRVLATLALRTPDAIGRRLALKLPVDAIAAVVPDRFPGAPLLAAGQVRAAASLRPTVLPAAPALTAFADTDLLTFVASLTTCLDAPWLSTFDTLP